MSGVQTTTIKNLNSSMEDALIIAVVIMKQSPRLFPNKDKVTEMRGVMNLTLRDSPRDVINCAVWGSEAFVTGYDQTFHIGDVVNVIKPRIAIRSLERNESFVPVSTSTFVLSINEGSGEIIVHEGNNYGSYMGLVHCPPAQDHLAISNIIQNGTGIHEDYVNLLVAVRDVKPAREIKTRSGKMSHCRDVIVMDQSNSSFLIQLWERELIERANQWRTSETILFLCDLRVRWSQYHRATTGTLGPRSIITEDPKGPHVDALRQYARSTPANDQAMAEHLASHAFPDPATINTVMSLSQLSDRAMGCTQLAASAGGLPMEDGSQFCALVYALVIQLDIDGCSPIFSIKCLRCRAIAANGVCTNERCPVASGLEPCGAGAGVVTTFDMRISVTDHTCTLMRLKLGGATAERMLGCTAEEFQKMEMDRRTALKWHFMLERCAIRVVVMKPTATRKQPIVTVLDCVRADPLEVLAKIPVY